MNRPKTDDDRKFEEIKQYVEALKLQLDAVHQHSHGLVEKVKDMAQALYQFGMAFTLLGEAGTSFGTAVARVIDEIPADCPSYASWLGFFRSVGAHNS